MFFIKILVWIALGVVISVVLPVVKEGYPKAKEGRFASTIGPIAKPYLLLGIGSVATAVLIMAGMDNLGQPIETWHQALLLGYFADATLQKFKPQGGDSG